MNQENETVIVEEVIVELVDLEEYAKREEHPPRARHYRFRLDDHYYTTEKHELTGREILAFANKSPEAYRLRERVHKKVYPIEPDQVVELRRHHLERFMTIPKENKDGSH